MKTSEILNLFQECEVPIIESIFSYYHEENRDFHSVEDGYQVTITYKFPKSSEWNNLEWVTEKKSRSTEGGYQSTEIYPSLSYPLLCVLTEDNPKLKQNLKCELCCMMYDRPVTYERVAKKISFIRSRLGALNTYNLKSLKAIINHYGIRVSDRRSKASMRRAISYELDRSLDQLETNKKFVKYYYAFEELYPEKEQTKIRLLISQL